MKFTTMWIALSLAAALAAQTSPDVALRAAMETETVKGGLKGAIEHYNKIAQGKDRALAAKALVRMAQCYQKLGDAEASRIYERVVREFADQKEAATEARARLDGLRPKPAVAGIVNRKVWELPRQGDIF